MAEYFIVYDIANARRLNRVAKILKDYGQRIQKSKFEANLEPAELKALQQRIGRIIDPQEDGVKYFPLCEKCFVKTEIFGKGRRKEHDPDFEIL